MKEYILSVVENGITYSVLTTNFGNEMWFLKNPDTSIFRIDTTYHRELGPAVTYYNGSTMWFFNGLKHRTDGPAVEWANGKKEYWFEGLKHRIDGPAVFGLDKIEYWYRDIYFDVHNQKDFELNIRLLLLK